MTYTTTQSQLPIFKTGKEYLALKLKSFKITIIKRTAKTVTFTLEANGEKSPFGVSTKKVKVINGSEYFFDGIGEYYADQTK